MRSNRANTGGFSAVEVLVVIFILALLGLAASWYFSRVKDAPNAAKSATQTNSASKTQNGNARSVQSQEVTSATGKKYVNNEYGFSFEYPSSWTLSEDLKDMGRGSSEGDVIVTSPNGTKVHFGPNLGGRGGDCIDPETETRTTKTCSTLNVISVEKLSTSSTAKPVYFYKMSLTAPTNSGGKTVYYVAIMSGESVPTKTGSSIGAYLYPYDEMYGTKVGYVTVYAEGKDDHLNTSSAFFDSAEVKEATPVLKSFLFLE